MEPGGRRRPDLYADIPVSVLHVPAGERGEPGGLPNFIKEEFEEEKEEYHEEKEVDEEEKRENYEKDEEMGGRGEMRRTCRTAWWWRRSRWSNSPLSPYHLSPSHASPAARFFLPRRS